MVPSSKVRPFDVIEGVVVDARASVRILSGHGVLPFRCEMTVIRRNAGPGKPYASAGKKQRPASRAFGH